MPGAFHLGGSREFSFAELASEYFHNEPEVFSKIAVRSNGGLFGTRIHNSLTTRLPPREAQYATLHTKDRVQMGLMSGHAYLEDPKRLAFTLSRYKFVSKILAGSTKTLEIGCADGFGSPLVAKEVGQLVATDFDESFVSDAKQTHPFSSDIEFRVHDMLTGPISQGFDSAYALDVLEHIAEEDEERFLRNVCGSLIGGSRCIFGMPSAESQIHASPISLKGHVNCKTAPDLKIFLEKFFRHVFVFSMNDEVVHTGFTPMAQYLLAVACEQKDYPS
jgi:2-polyprenyl-3-methyl-5-hydroxy-6-metoxy-1,4-benzoquinol methylase